MSDRTDRNPGTLSEEPAGWQHMRTKLLAEMKAALLASPSGFVNLSKPKHAVTTPCLWEVAYDSAFSGKHLDVRWSDGSSTRFPCGVLAATPETSAPKVRLRLGLMSFRHPELDYLVDLYACRNRELAILKSMAAEEEYSFSRAREILLDPALQEAVVEVYHTGLEPMVVGFYRGVISSLAERKTRGLPRNLLVQPMFYAGAPEREELTPNSPGADPNRYIRSKVWM